MRYQIIEALEKVGEFTNKHPNDLFLAHMDTDNIQITFVDDRARERKFKYVSGKIFVLNDIEHHWILVD